MADREALPHQSYPDSSACVGQLVVYQWRPQALWVVEDTRTGEILGKYARYAEAVQVAMDHA